MGNAIVADVAGRTLSTTICMGHGMPCPYMPVPARRTTHAVPVHIGLCMANGECNCRRCCRKNVIYDHLYGARHAVPLHVGPCMANGECNCRRCCRKNVIYDLTYLYGARHAVPLHVGPCTSPPTRRPLHARPLHAVPLHGNLVLRCRLVGDFLLQALFIVSCRRSFQVRSDTIR